eukprot:TRINITY_DN959_c0_g2_i2.p1 TRINITY_DN959_c0_g2~~TRINITY_DN959_c0_g2_i2.p1  ORF type:complete len:496 (+),score=80.97 TRINITY_DN959_c0_g2_i2:66-1490(+)
MRMMAITLPLLAVVGYGKVVPVPEVPYITPIQQAAINKAATLGKEAAAAARPQLLELMQRPAFRSYLKEMADRPELANMQPEDILTNIGLQYQAAEVVHNWNPASNNPTMDIRDIDLSSTLPYKTFFQEWQLGSLGFVENVTAGSSSVANWNEMELFNFPNFTTTKPDYIESSNRVIYGALNIRKLSTGNIFFGTVSSVFKNSRIRNTSIVFPVDSGLYADACSPLPDKFIPGFHFNCSQVQPVGNFDFWEHTILANVMLVNGTGGIGQPPIVPQAVYQEYNMAYLVATFLNEDYSKMTPIVNNRMTDYIESNPAMNARWSTDLKMLIIAFRENLFGTGNADILRQWAISNNWVVVWGNDYLNHSTIGSKNPGLANQRFLDPIVLSQITAGGNSTSDPAFPSLSESFRSLWNTTNATLPGLPPSEVASFYTTTWNTAWNTFKGTILEVQPLTGTSCSDHDCAVVRVVDKKCICG